MTTQSNFNIENIVHRCATSQQLFQEYTHECRQEYTIAYALCVNCTHRLEVSRGIHKKPAPTECYCDDIPPYVSEQCIHCAAIKEEIVFLKNEIRRSCATYGIEVAETLETNPLFGETIEKLVFRIEILEQILLRQLIDAETAARKQPPADEDEDEAANDDATTVSENEEPEYNADTETQSDNDEDHEIESITRGIAQINPDGDSGKNERTVRKRPRPESPELWLYDGSMV